MFRLLFIFCLTISTNTSLANQVREYRETKKGITLIAFYGDSTERMILDAFLDRLSQNLKRPSQLKIMIIVDYDSQAPWNAIVGYDTLRFDLHFIDEPVPRKKDSIVEVILNKTAPIDTGYKMQKPVAIDWSGSYDRSQKELGLKILYRWSASDSNVIFFDRIYSLAKYGLEHIEEIKKRQKRIEMEYYGVWPLSVLSIDTFETKKIPLRSLGFDPNNIQVDTKSNSLIWICSTIIPLMLLLFFVVKKKRS